MFKSSLILGVSILLFSCNQSENTQNLSKSESKESINNADDNASANSNASFQAYGNSTSASNEIKIDDRKLIWTAILDFEVKNVNVSTDKISALAEKYDAQISDMELKSYSEKVANRIVIRVPNHKFQKLVTALKGESIYMNRADVNSQDVTEEFVDIESRLQAKKVVRDRYIEILRTRTGSITDVLAAEESIRVITEEIEAKEGRLRYLSNRVNFSSITVHIYHKIDRQDVVVVEEPTYSNKVSDSFSHGWSGITNIFLGLVSVWPLMLVLISIIIWKRRRIGELFKSVKK